MHSRQLYIGARGGYGDRGGADAAAASILISGTNGVTAGLQRQLQAGRGYPPRRIGQHATTVNALAERCDHATYHEKTVGSNRLPYASKGRYL